MTWPLRYLPMLRPFPTQARNDFGSNNGRRLDAMARPLGREWWAEFDGKARSVPVLAGRNFQLSTNLLYQRTYNFHSKTLALSGVESLRQSRAVIQHR